MHHCLMAQMSQCQTLHHTYTRLTINTLGSAEGQSWSECRHMDISATANLALHWSGQNESHVSSV